MLSLSSELLLEKNRINSLGAWLLLLEVVVDESTAIRLVANTEDIVWDDKTWTAFPFEIEDIKESTKEYPEVNVKISNVTRFLQPYVEDAQGFLGKEVNLIVVHTEHLDIIEPELEAKMYVTKTTYDGAFITFTLGSRVPRNLKAPKYKYNKGFCRFKYGSPMCGKTPTETYPTCDRKFASCELRGNQTRFGGYPAIPLGGLYI